MDLANKELSKYVLQLALHRLQQYIGKFMQKYKYKLLQSHSKKLC